MRDYQRGLSQEHLKTDVLYDPATGEFIRRKTGNVAGCTRRDGKGKYYRELRVAGDTYYAHRLAWFYVHGVWPRYMIDHINGDGTDNRISNLRDCTNSQNTFHSSKSNRSGLRGVSYVPEMKRYRAHIRKDMKLKHLGYFYTEQEAFAAYVKAGRSLFGDFIHADILAVIRTFNPSEGAK